MRPPGVTEPLGIDFLEENDCQWDFVRGCIVIAGREVVLVRRPNRPVVRRVYVQENVMVPPCTQVDVPVRLAWTTYERGANKTQWVFDSKELSQDVVVARSLLPETGTKTFVRAINLSDQPRILSSGLCMGGAEPAVVVRSGSPANKPRQAPSPGLNSPATWPRHMASQCGPTPAPPRPAIPATCCCGCSVSDSHLQPVVEGFSDNLSGHELSKARQLVYEYSDVFSQSEFDLGHCADLPHRIDTGDARPFKEQLRSHCEDRWMN